MADKQDIEFVDGSNYIEGDSVRDGALNNLELSYLQDAKVIDFDKVQNLGEIINILEAMDLHIYDDESPRFDKIRHLLKDPE